MSEQDIKEIKLRIPLAAYEELYRLFPLRGEIQQILLDTIGVLIKKTKTDKNFYNDILENMRG
jgi:hypothetical protein